MSAPLTLEAQLLDLLERHNLSSVSLQALRLSDGRLILSASAQGDGKCAFNKIGATSAEIVGSAISELNAVRHPKREYVETFALLEVAA